MLVKRFDLAIINRSFWPVYPVIGEALLRYAEGISADKRVCIIMQDRVDVRAKLNESERGQGVDFFPCKALATSSSGILRRIIDALFFMAWVVGVLIFTRPKKVYISTDPPVLVPFVVMLYCKVFNSSYVYHLQDIHPEAANVVISINKIIYRILRWMDSAVMRNAEKLITITDEMAHEIHKRSRTRVNVHVVNNPAVSFSDVDLSRTKRRGFSFCGNAGRLQRIPLLISSIQRYLDNGGQLDFAFAGGGVYANNLVQLSLLYPQVEYFGLISPRAAAQLNTDYAWALLPIDDDVTRFAFPSKSSSYVFSGAYILAVCGENTSVAQLVTEHRLGLCVEPAVDAVADIFHRIENSEIDFSMLDTDRSSLKSQLDFDHFITQLNRLILN